MLNLAGISPALSSIGSVAAEYHERMAKQLSFALEVCRLTPNFWEANIDIINASISNVLSAKLLNARPVACYFDSPIPPSNYTAIAVDGSQIPLDRHSPIPYFLINIGEAVIHYGSRDRPRLCSCPTLFYTEDQILQKGNDGEMSYATDAHVAQIRSKLEISRLSNLILDSGKRQNVIGLVDGPLILWTQDPKQTSRHASPAIKELCSLLSAAQTTGAAIIGYISRPGSREVVNVIRKASSIAADEKSASPIPLDRINDSQLFAAILQSGQRSAVFESSAEILKRYETGADRIGFFYFHTGKEIARVELPIKGAEVEPTAAAVHALLLDQACKGGGYPISLMESHEQAVVRIEDRSAVEHLIINELHRRRVQITNTRKALSKRVRPI